MLQFLKNNNIEYKQNVSISQLTGMYQGGTIPFVVYPSTYDQIVLLYRYVNDNHLRFDILGSITNTYIASTYHCDVVIKTTKYNDFSIHNDTAYASCGCLLTKVAQKLSSFGCKGYEGLVGIPGTIGAAAINNSGAFDSSMDKVVRAVTIINANGLISKLSNEQLKYKTRHSILKGSNNSCMVLTVELDISRRGDVTSIQKSIQRNIRYRKVVIDGKRKSLGSCFVSSSLKHLHDSHKIMFFIKRIVSGLIKPFYSSQALNTYLDFLFLGHPELHKHCDSLNRFAWDKRTKEHDFFYYIDTMQSLADNKLELEIEIRS